MPVTDISVCNSALIKCGADIISSLTQETKSARLLNSVYTMIRDEVLMAHPWNFALKRATLTPTANTPEYEYDYEFDLPNDCLRVISCEWDLQEDADYVIEGRTILSDEATMPILYIYRNDDPNSWTAMFAECLAWRLAQEVSYGLTQSSARQGECAKAYQNSLREARSFDGMEGTMKKLSADRWALSRR